MWRRTYLFLVLVRLWFALSPSYLHPDENFQGPEVIAGMFHTLLDLPAHRSRRPGSLGPWSHSAHRFGRVVPHRADGGVALGLRTECWAPTAMQMRPNTFTGFEPQV